MSQKKPERERKTKRTRIGKHKQTLAKHVLFVEGSLETHRPLAVEIRGFLPASLP